MGVSAHVIVVLYESGLIEMVYHTRSTSATTDGAAVLTHSGTNGSNVSHFQHSDQQRGGLSLSPQPSDVQQRDVS